MAWLLAIPLVLLLLMCYLLFAPFYLEIDTTRDIYRARFHTLAAAGLAECNRSLALSIRVLWWKKEIAVEELLVSSPARTKNRTERRRTKKEKRGIPLRKIQAVAKSFKVTDCDINIDFGDVNADGLLLPVVYYLARISGRRLAVNFLGQTWFVFSVRNSLASMVWAYIRA